MSVCAPPLCILLVRMVQNRKRNQHIFLEIASTAIKNAPVGMETRLEESVGELKGSTVLPFSLSVCRLQLCPSIGAYTMGVVSFPQPLQRNLDPSSASQPHDLGHDFDFIEPHPRPLVTQDNAQHGTSKDRCSVSIILHCFLRKGTYGDWGDSSVNKMLALQA